VVSSQINQSTNQSTTFPLYALQAPTLAKLSMGSRCGEAHSIRSLPACMWAMGRSQWGPTNVSTVRYDHSDQFCPLMVYTPSLQEIASSTKLIPPSTSCGHIPSRQRTHYSSVVLLITPGGRYIGGVPTILYSWLQVSSGNVMCLCMLGWYMRISRGKAWVLIIA